MRGIKEIYEDEDGIWCLLKKGYIHGTDETQVIHCETYKELKEELKEVKKL